VLLCVCEEFMRFGWLHTATSSGCRLGFGLRTRSVKVCCPWRRVSSSSSSRFSASLSDLGRSQPGQRLRIPERPGQGFPTLRSSRSDALGGLVTLVDQAHGTCWSMSFGCLAVVHGAARIAPSLRLPGSVGIGPHGPSSGEKPNWVTIARGNLRLPAGVDGRPDVTFSCTKLQLFGPTYRPSPWRFGVYFGACHRQ